jgi:hypothetical protein
MAAAPSAAAIRPKTIRTATGARRVMARRDGFVLERTKVYQD